MRKAKIEKQQRVEYAKECALKKKKAKKLARKQRA